MLTRTWRLGTTFALSYLAVCCARDRSVGPSASAVAASSSAVARSSSSGAPSGPWGSDRASSPLEDPAVGVAAADLVAVVTATSFGGGTATVQVVDILKDDASGVSRGGRIQVKGIASADEPAKRWEDPGPSMGSGKNYLVLLWSPVPGSSEYHVVDEVGGVKEDGPAAQAAIKTAVAKPQSSSRWKAGPLGVQARLVVDVGPPSDVGEINLLVVIRNTSEATVDFTYRSWPEEEQSKCSLHIENLASKQRIEAKDVPIAKQNIADHFSKHGRSYQTKIESGQSHLHRLPRVTTARKGWGYKEELGFRYYPVSQPGEHSISATCSNLLGPGSVITTEALTMTL